MKLVRYGAAGREKPGMIDGDGRIRDLSEVIPDLAGAALSCGCGRGPAQQAPHDQRQRQRGRPQRQAVYVQQHPAGERRATPGERPQGTRVRHAPARALRTAPAP